MRMNCTLLLWALALVSVAGCSSQSRFGTVTMKVSDSEAHIEMPGNSIGLKLQGSLSGLVKCSDR